MPLGQTQHLLALPFGENIRDKQLAYAAVPCPSSSEYVTGIDFYQTAASKGFITVNPQSLE